MFIKLLKTVIAIFLSMFFYFEQLKINFMSKVLLMQITIFYYQHNDKFKIILEMRTIAF